MLREMITSNELMELLCCSKSKAYEIIIDLNNELERQGIKTLKGRVSKSYFLKRYGLEIIN